jgi:phosphate transport system permease protein
VSAIPDPSYALTPSGNLRRRAIVSRAIESAAIAAAALAVIVLGILVVYVTVRGIGAMSLSFFTSSLPSQATGAGGGVGPALLGTAELVLIATLIALPAGVLSALYLNEFAGPRAGNILRLFLDLMNGLPTIITGVFIFGILVVPTRNQSALAGSLALAIVMTPLIARTSIEALARIPPTWREAADALGVARWRTVLGVILPGAAGGIATATILAVARAAGETAPLLLTDTLFTQNVQVNPLHAVPNIPFEIYTLVETGYPQAIQSAWGMAFVLLVAILAANIGARLLLRRSQKKRGL